MFKSASFSGLFGSPSPPATRSPSPAISREVSQTADDILEQVGVIPPQFIDGIRTELIKVLSSPNHRPFPELIVRAGTPCVREYLNDSFTLLLSQIASAEKALSQFKPGPDRDDFLANTAFQQNAYFGSIAQLLGQGFEVALKPNLIFDAAGNPTGIREKDRGRFPGCHAYLIGRLGGKRRRTLRKKLKRNVHRFKLMHQKTKSVRRR